MQINQIEIDDSLIETAIKASSLNNKKKPCYYLSRKILHKTLLMIFIIYLLLN